MSAFGTADQDCVVDGVLRQATLSEDGRYRYSLSRGFVGSRLPPLVFIGLNPSTADGLTDDPTIRRCVRFARDWGFSGFTMLNLYAWRATDPGKLPVGRQAVGPLNDFYLKVGVAGGGRGAGSIVVCMWGAHPTAQLRARKVLDMIGGPVHVLGLTKAGAPRHPLYMRADTVPVLWTP